MGCDIHGIIEKRVSGKWVAHHELPEKGGRRNYDRFARLAGVRGDGPTPLGVPADASDTAKLLIDEWGIDGHSHSYLPIQEAATIFMETDFSKDEFAEKYPLSHYFDIEDEYCSCCGRQITDTKWRLVFWFDN